MLFAPCSKKKQDVNAFFEADGPAALTWLYQVNQLHPWQFSSPVVFLTLLPPQVPQGVSTNEPQLYLSKIQVGGTASMTQ